MSIAEEILNTLDVGWKPFQLIPSPSIAYNRKEKVFPSCDASFQSPKYGHRQATIALLVNPFANVHPPASLAIWIH